MVTVALFDTLTIRTTSDEASSPGVVLTCDDPAIPSDRANLVVRAAEALLPRRTSHEGTAISLAKRIPAGGGLGGGSSDAARTLLGLNQFWNLHQSPAQLAEIAATLGSDVPFFLHGPSNICSGRGEFVQPTPAPRLARWATLFLPGIPIPTADVYRKFDELRLGDEGFEGRQPDWQEWAGLSAGPLLSRLANDLEVPAFALVPRLRELRDALEDALGRVIRMSGSGSTLFTLFDTQEQAERAAQSVQAQYGVTSLPAELAPRIVDDLSDGAG
jgi:4-diphosphocytidyl-2-C-methyl-D-erythritol kinase